ncbi:CapA family protein [Lacrimispora amygdalina]|uniref:CapA family protein n=1 Tax=Lacrimispora amygdalina TaxID=253257 RepID=A0A3E2NBX4_9FIRM|nr:CapA family protein [Clostridium indicum]RFZ78473.1 CapA family protein [Clostridium indicum]
MKKTNATMKFLIILPVLLFVLLAGWIGGTEWKVRQGGKEAVSKADRNTLVSSDQQAAKATVEESSSLEVPTEAEETKESGTSQEQKPVVHLLFAGDILLSTHVTSAYDKSGGINGILDEGMRSEISKADIFMANQEFPFSSRGFAAPDKQFTFRLNPDRVTMMNEIGVDIVTIANNHTLDYGTDALLDTCTALDGAGIRYVGAGPDMNRAKQLETMEVNGKTFGFLAASRVYPDPDWVANSKKPGMVSGYDPSILLEEIQKARSLCDYLVVYVHWGVEREEKPKDYQRQLGQQIIDAGADLVVGSHPHVLQGVEYYKGKPICYSLGNFIFGSSIPKTALMRAEVDFEGNTTSLSLVPGTSGAGFTKTLTKPEDIKGFYQYFQDISFGITIDDNGVIHNNGN